MSKILELPVAYFTKCWYAWSLMITLHFACTFLIHQTQKWDHWTTPLPEWQTLRREEMHPWEHLDLSRCGHPRASSQIWLGWGIDHEAMLGLPRNVTSDSSKTPQDWQHVQVEVGKPAKNEKETSVCSFFLYATNASFLSLIYFFNITNGPFQCTHHGISSNLIAYPKCHMQGISFTVYTCISHKSKHSIRGASGYWSIDSKWQLENAAFQTTKL